MADLNQGRPDTTMVQGRPRLFYEVNNAVMSVAVRTEGREFQRGAPQRVIEADRSFASAFETGSWDVAPDGKRFVLMRDEQSGGSAGPATVKFTFHWFEELKRLVPRK